jgi:hypothetical protein
MQIIDPLVTYFSLHPGAPTCFFTPEMLRAKEHAPIPYYYVIFTLDSHLKLSRSLGVRHRYTIKDISYFTQHCQIYLTKLGMLSIPNVATKPWIKL